jgi:hypothetical protein
MNGATHWNPKGLNGKPSREFEVQSVSDNQRENDFELESSRLNEGLKTCRAVNNYRAMIVGEQPRADNDDSEMSDYVSTTGKVSGAYEGNSATN